MQIIQMLGWMLGCMLLIISFWLLVFSNNVKTNIEIAVYNFNNKKIFMNK